jgi:hypothetical protein
VFPVGYELNLYVLLRRNSFIRDKHNLSSERMLHKDYDRKGSAEKNPLVLSLKGLGVKTELICGKPPVTK